MRKYKESLAKYNAILDEFPEVKEALAPPGTKAAAAKPEEQKKAPAAATEQATMSITDIYETYHDAEQTKAMSVIEKELTRCSQIKDSSKDEDIQDLMEERIEQLKMNKESTEEDINGGFLSIDGYLAQLKKYCAYEVANLKGAQGAGIGAEHLELIQDRIDTAKSEMADMQAGMAGQAAEAEAAVAAAQAEAAAKAAQTKAKAEAAKPESAKPKANYDQKIHGMICDRVTKYKHAVSYQMKILGNKAKAVELMNIAEKSQKAANGYRDTGKLDKENVPKALDSETLFGMKNEEKAEKFAEIIMELDAKSKDLQGKARRCLEGAKKVKKPDEQAKLKANASQLINAAK